MGGGWKKEVGEDNEANEEKDNQLFARAGCLEDKEGGLSGGEGEGGGATRRGGIRIPVAATPRPANKLRLLYVHTYPWDWPRQPCVCVFATRSQSPRELTAKNTGANSHTTTDTHTARGTRRAGSGLLGRGDPGAGRQERSRDSVPPPRDPPQEERLPQAPHLRHQQGMCVHF